MHIRIVAPVLYSPALVDKAVAEYRAVASPGTVVSAVALPNGTRTIESDYDIALAAPETMRLIVQAESDGVDACVVTCFSDPGVAGAREQVSIPVIGEGQAGLNAASLLGNRICIVTTWNQCIPRMRRLVAAHGMDHRLAAVCAANRGVMDLDERSVPDLAEMVTRAVDEKGADVVVMACTGTGLDMAAAMEEALETRLGRAIPVIDPGKAAMALAQSSVAMGFGHSKVAFPQPVQQRDEYRFSPAQAAE